MSERYVVGSGRSGTRLERIRSFALLRAAKRTNRSPSHLVFPAKRSPRILRACTCVAVFTAVPKPWSGGFRLRHKRPPVIVEARDKDNPHGLGGRRMAAISR